MNIDYDYFHECVTYYSILYCLNRICSTNCFNHEFLHISEPISIRVSYAFHIAHSRWSTCDVQLAEATKATASDQERGGTESADTTATASV